VEYVSRVPRPPLDGLIDDLYYLEGAPPYPRLTLPPMPGALLIVNLGAPFQIRAGSDIAAADCADEEVVGVTPKRFARTYRFTATVLAIDPAGPVDWLELAGRAGYYDQAHFGHDFRTFTGLTPTRYLDLRRRFLREHPGHPLVVGPLPAD
jgi:Helix-turn-helix domain